MYERELGVPYCLQFAPDKQELRIFRHNGERYLLLSPNKDAWFSVPESELRLRLLGGWVRFWHRDQLLLLPGEMWARLMVLKAQHGLIDEEVAAPDGPMCLEQELKQ